MLRSKAGKSQIFDLKDEDSWIAIFINLLIAKGTYMEFKSLFLAALMSAGMLLSLSVSAAHYTLVADSNPLNTGTIALNQEGPGNAALQGDDVKLNPGQIVLFPDVVDLSGSVFGFVANKYAASGTFSIAPSVWDSWDSIFIGLKQSNSYAIFELTSTILSGTWSTTCGSKKPKACADLSHYFAFGGDPVVVNPPNEVPVPAAVWLFGSAMAGIFGVNRRKRVA